MSEIPKLGKIRTLPSWESLRGGGYEVPLDEALNIIDQFRAKVAEQSATIQRLEQEIEDIKCPLKPEAHSYSDSFVTHYCPNLRRAKLAEANLVATRETVERLTEALQMLYDEYENGDPCTEYGDEDGSYIGNAVRLSSEQDDQVLAALEAAGVKTALSFTVDGKHKAARTQPAAKVVRLTEALQQLTRMFWTHDNLAFRETTRSIVRGVLSANQISDALADPCLIQSTQPAAKEESQPNEP